MSERPECTFAIWNPSWNYISAQNIFIRADAIPTRKPGNRNLLKERRAGGSGCILKKLNDGVQLPQVYTDDGKLDITCVGPENPECPQVQGFVLVNAVKFADGRKFDVQVPRLKGTQEDEIVIFGRKESEDEM